MVWGCEPARQAGLGMALVKMRAYQGPLWVCAILRPLTVTQTRTRTRTRTLTLPLPLPLTLPLPLPLTLTLALTPTLTPTLTLSCRRAGLCGGGAVQLFGCPAGACVCCCELLRK